MKDEEPGVSETTDASATAARIAVEAKRHLLQPLAPGLHLVATPIGNRADISLRALATLARADVVYCEDTRHSRPLLSHFGIHTPLRAYHEHNAQEERPRILQQLEAGRAVALISDAGTPLVSDPGFKLVRDAAAAGYSVTAVPGPSATLAALCVSGLPTDAFFFAGFLPAREGARKTRLTELVAIPGSLVIFEAPTRAAATLADLRDTLGDREAVMARELTKLHEEARRGRLAQLAESAERDPPRGEIVIVVGPPETGEISDDAILESLTPALESLSVRDAAKIVAERLKVPKARVYDLALTMKRGNGG